MSEPENNSSPEDRRGTMLRRILAMPNDSTAKTLVVAVTLCLVCAVVVSTAAVLLRPIQLENRVLDRQRNILQAAGLYQPGASIDEQFGNIETRVVDLATGDYVEDLDPAGYEQRKAAKDPRRSIALTSDEDIANIGRRARYAKVYLVKDGERLDKVILPVHGYGLWSTMYGFLALEADGNTIYGLRFYEHAETPGLGGEVDNPKWRSQWQGKKIFDDNGDITIEVMKGAVPENHPDAVHRVDGLSGATLTSRGVTALMRYWLSEGGFQPYLAKIRQSSG